MVNQRSNITLTCNYENQILLNTGVVYISNYIAATSTMPYFKLYTTMSVFFFLSNCVKFSVHQRSNMLS